MKKVFWILIVVVFLSMVPRLSLAQDSTQPPGGATLFIPQAVSPMPTIRGNIQRYCVTTGQILGPKEGVTVMNQNDFRTISDAQGNFWLPYARGYVWMEGYGVACLISSPSDPDVSYCRGYTPVLC